MTTTVGLIAKREIVTRLRSRALRIATAVSVLILVGLAVAGRPADGGAGGGIPAPGQRLAVGVLTSVLIYFALLLNGQAVAQGVVEEKTSRVVELLLATVRPGQLMIGKVLGLGVVGLIQIAVIALCGVAAAFATGALHLHAVTALGGLVWLIVWFLLGYAAFSLAFAAVAALVSRQEEVAAAVTPVLMLLAAGYVTGVAILPSKPGSPLVATLSMIPVFAPTLMPVRLALGVVPAWQTALSLAGMVAVIPLLLQLSARIYRHAILHSGARVRLRDALRG
jgi:ABC-2 type transport system permease protein